MRRTWLIPGIALLLSALPSVATDVAVLHNGFSIRNERHEVIGTVTRLYLSSTGGYLDVPSSQIDHFEKDTTPAPVASPPPAQSARVAAPPPAASGPNPLALPAKTAPPVGDLVTDASSQYHLDPDLVNSVIRAESGFNTRAVSPKGAQGLMQLMPRTASKLGVANAFDPKANVQGGTQYLRALLEKYNFDLIKALAAYNAGPQRVEHYGGLPPYYETQAYVARIIRDFNRKKLAERKKAAAERTKAAKATTPARTTHSTSLAQRASNPQRALTTSLP